MTWKNNPYRVAAEKRLERAFPTEPRDLKHLVAVTIFALCAGLAVYGGIHLGWAQADMYWICHLLYGIGLPLGIYAASTSMRLGTLSTAVWSLGNELWEDQLTRPVFTVDWSHLSADFVGIAIALLIWQLLRRVGRTADLQATSQC